MERKGKGKDQVYFQRGMTTTTMKLRVQGTSSK